MNWIEEMGVRMGGLRRAKGLKQWELAVQIDTAPHMVSRYECGTRLITTAKLRQLAIILDTSVDYLMFGDSNDRSMETQEVAESRTD